jgi:hypothetical protein
MKFTGGAFSRASLKKRQSAEMLGANAISAPLSHLVGCLMMASIAHESAIFDAGR